MTQNSKKGSGWRTRRRQATANHVSAAVSFALIMRNAVAASASKDGREVGHALKPSTPAEGSHHSRVGSQVRSERRTAIGAFQPIPVHSCAGANQAFDHFM